MRCCWYHHVSLLNILSRSGAGLQTISFDYVAKASLGREPSRLSCAEIRIYHFTARNQKPLPAH